jgi:hypothetical protein
MAFKMKGFPMIKGTKKHSAMKFGIEHKGIDSAARGTKGIGSDGKPLKMKKGDEQGTKPGQYTGAGIPEFLYNADGKKINTNNIDEGNLSKIKVESGTKRKYVEYVEGSKAGGRLYLSNPE